MDGRDAWMDGSGLLVLCQGEPTRLPCKHAAQANTCQQSGMHTSRRICSDQLCTAPEHWLRCSTPDAWCPLRCQHGCGARGAVHPAPSRLQDSSIQPHGCMGRMGHWAKCA
jgi:hypothetical protein